MTKAKKYLSFALILIWALSFLPVLGCIKENPVLDRYDGESIDQQAFDPKGANEASTPESSIEAVKESSYLDAFKQNAFEKDLKVFQEPQPSYEDDPDRTLKECIDAYLYARNQILSDMHQPFSTMEAVSTMMYYCDPSFQMQAKVTIWYRFYLRKTNQRNIDLSYAHFIHRTVYTSITYKGDEAFVTVQDAIQFQHVNSDVISSSGDTHTIHARKNGDTWKIVYDDPGALEEHIVTAYQRFLSECPYTEPEEIEHYIKERFAAWGSDAHPPISVTEEP